MPGQGHFQVVWLEQTEFRDWVGKVAGDNMSAYCRVCNKSISVKSLGVSALKTHAKGSKHMKAMKFVSSLLGNIDALIQGDRDKTTTTTTTTTSLQTSGRAVQSKILTAGTQTLSAEILWTLKCVDSHYSFHSCKETDKLFKRMLPGHHVSETFSCGENKARYLAEFGLAPHFSSLLKSRIKKDNDYVLLFDESMNSKTKNKQLDIHI